MEVESHSVEKQTHSEVAEAPLHIRSSQALMLRCVGWSSGKLFFLMLWLLAAIILNTFWHIIAFFCLLGGRYFFEVAQLFQKLKVAPASSFHSEPRVWPILAVVDGGAFIYTLELRDECCAWLLCQCWQTRGQHLLAETSELSRWQSLNRCFAPWWWTVCLTVVLPSIKNSNKGQQASHFLSSKS